jgi:hypothetical protein
MEPFVQLVVQSAALGLLSYLIWWVTQTGAPQLFAILSTFSTTVASNTKVVEDLRDEIKELRREMENRRGA